MGGWVNDEDDEDHFHSFFMMWQRPFKEVFRVSSRNETTSAHGIHPMSCILGRWTSFLRFLPYQHPQHLTDNLIN